ncbi:hypothetical protein JCM5353_001811 [Sporobolomyces roseus]
MSTYSRDMDIDEDPDHLIKVWRGKLAPIVRNIRKTPQALAHRDQFSKWSDELESRDFCSLIRNRRDLEFVKTRLELLRIALGTLHKNHLSIGFLLTRFGAANIASQLPSTNSSTSPRITPPSFDLVVSSPSPPGSPSFSHHSDPMDETSSPKPSRNRPINQISGNRRVQKRRIRTRAKKPSSIDAAAEAHSNFNFNSHSLAHRGQISSRHARMYNIGQCECGRAGGGEGGVWFA